MSAYVIPIFTRLRRHLKQYKKATQDSFRQSPVVQHQRHVHYLTSHNMDQLKSLDRIEELCHNLRRQREQEQQSSPTITPTG